MQGSMKRLFGLLVVSLAAFVAVPGAAHAAPSPIAKALGNLRWGMSESEVKGALKAKTDARALAQSHVDFNGARTRHDGSIVGEEYTHGNEESMLTFKDSSADNYLFFIGDELWKWVKVYPAAAFKGNFADSVKKKFGKGYEKQGEVNPGSGASYSYVEFLDRNTRLRAVDKSNEYRSVVLMFESMDTVRSLSSLRSNTIRRGTPPKKSTAVASKRPSSSDDDGDDDRFSSGRAPARMISAPAKSASNSSKKQSIFAGENQNHDETDAEYEARKARMKADARDKQQRTHERTQEAKKGKILDDLAEIDDSDPISGMGH